MTELVLPQHTNAVGTVFGGTVMSWIDICAAICAQRHTNSIVVTAAVDDLIFRAPLRLGDVVRLTARVNAAFRKSLEVEVCVEREERATGHRSLCVDARLTFVALDDAGEPALVPGLHAETPEERSREREAQTRREERLARKHQRKEGSS